MDRYWKEVIQVSTWKNDIKVQYPYDNTTLALIVFCYFCPNFFSQAWRLARSCSWRLDVFLFRDDCLRHLFHLETCKRKSWLALTLTHNLGFKIEHLCALVVSIDLFSFSFMPFLYSEVEPANKKTIPKAPNGILLL